jgi:hypothetical protein
MHFFQALIALSFFICIFTTSLDEEDTALAWWPELTHSFKNRQTETETGRFDRLDA